MVLDVISAFHERETRDELGLGTIRDVIADLFFPGTNTIQTRARYFLLVPWVYQGLEGRIARGNIVAAEVVSRARYDETSLIPVLARSGDPVGTIGVQAGRSLQRLPSNIYWSGLLRWGIRQFPGSQDQYHRSLHGFRGTAATPRDDDGEPVAGRVTRNWHASLPPPPPEFPNNVSLALSPEEAEYLRERIVTASPGSMLAFLVDRGRPADQTSFPWLHPQVGEMPATVREQLEHARTFSEITWGASLLYNLMLSRLSDNEESVQHYEGQLGKWAWFLGERSAQIAAWDRARFWQIVSTHWSIPALAKQFVNAWVDLALAMPSTTIADNQRALRLIYDRERALKGALARLDNRRALEHWTGDAGSSQLSFRWPVAQRMVADIHAGLARGDVALPPTPPELQTVLHA